MYSNLALNNVKKSFKDYTIYFLTLTFAVAIFYSFNSIGSQKAMMAINENKADAIVMVSEVISGISVFVSFILGGLILYANNFLIKRRKKELGVYMSLGMGKNKMSKILVVEELIIGTFSLIVGLILGIIASQALSAFTAKLFNVGLDKYKFIISTDAIIKTIIYFGIIFILVMIFNTIIISKYKLIDLLNAHKKNESIKVKNTAVAALIFIVSLISIGIAYYLVTKVGLDITSLGFKLSIVLGIFGTLLFFYGLTSFLIMVIQRNKNIYLKRLNIFTLRQMNSKINTNFVSMTVICLMLFLTISMLSTGVSFKRQNVDSSAPFDASAYMYSDIDNNKTELTLEQILDKNNFKLPNGDKAAYLTQYNLKNNLKDILYKYSDGKIKESFNGGYESKVTAVSISDYNKSRELLGEKPIILKDNEFLVQSNSSIYKSAIEKFINENGKININGTEYIAKNKDIIDKPLGDDVISSVIFNLIVPDNVVNGLQKNTYYINIMYGKNKDVSEKYITDFFKDPGKFKQGFIIGSTRTQIIEGAQATTTLLLFITLYIGIIFLISSAAVLALQQLSEASDSASRYNSLRRIGTPEKMISKSIFIQTLAYFMLPLVLAIVHSIVGINVVSDFISMFGKGSIVKSSIMTMGVIILVYGGYFITTYIGYKNIVKKS